MIINGNHCAEVIINGNHCAAVIINGYHCAAVIINSDYCAEVIINSNHCTEVIIKGNRCAEVIINGYHCAAVIINDHHCKVIINGNHCAEVIINGNHCELECSLSSDMARMSHFCRQWRLKPSASKTISSVFHLHNTDATHELSVYLDGQHLRHECHPTYPGVTLDCMPGVHNIRPAGRMQPAGLYLVAHQILWKTEKIS